MLYSRAFPPKSLSQVCLVKWPVTWSNMQLQLHRRGAIHRIKLFVVSKNLHRKQLCFISGSTFIFLQPPFSSVRSTLPAPRPPPHSTAACLFCVRWGRPCRGSWSGCWGPRPCRNAGRTPCSPGSPLRPRPAPEGSRRASRRESRGPAGCRGRRRSGCPARGGWWSGACWESRLTRSRRRTAGTERRRCRPGAGGCGAGTPPRPRWRSRRGRNGKHFRPPPARWALTLQWTPWFSLQDPHPPRRPRWHFLPRLPPCLQEVRSHRLVLRSCLVLLLWLHASWSSGDPEEERRGTDTECLHVCQLHTPDN